MTKITIHNILGIKYLFVSEDFDMVMRLIDDYQSDGFITLHQLEEFINIAIRVSDIVEILDMENREEGEPTK